MGSPHRRSARSRSWPSWVEPFDIIQWQPLAASWRFCHVCSMVIGPHEGGYPCMECFACGTLTLSGIPERDHSIWDTSTPKRGEAAPGRATPQTHSLSTQRRSNSGKRN
jgi:hypothetical protein